MLLGSYLGLGDWGLNSVRLTIRCLLNYEPNDFFSINYH